MDWKPFPLYVFKTDLDHVILPTPRDFATLSEARTRVASDLEDLEKLIVAIPKNKALDEIDKDKALSEAKNRIRSAQTTLDEHDRQVNRLMEAFESKKGQATLKEYELAWPGFDEYLKAEDDAKDYVDDVPRMNQGRLARRLLSDHVKLDGVVLGVAEIGKLPHIEANALWSELKTMVYSDYSRLPFM